MFLFIAITLGIHRLLLVWPQQVNLLSTYLCGSQCKELFKLAAKSQLSRPRPIRKNLFYFLFINAIRYSIVIAWLSVSLFFSCAVFCFACLVFRPRRPSTTETNDLRDEYLFKCLSYVLFIQFENRIAVSFILFCTGF